MKPSKEQLEIIQSNLEKCIVYAGPGSGKTAVIQNRIEYIMSEFGIIPQEIAIFSYTNLAANEIKKRVVDNSKVNDIEKIIHGTLHSFAKDQIQLYTENQDNFRILQNEFEIFNYEENLISNILDGKYDNTDLIENEDIFKKYLEVIAQKQSDISDVKLSILNSNLSPASFQAALDEGTKEDEETINILKSLGVKEKDMRKNIQNNFLNIMISENTHTFDTLLLLYRQLLTDKEHINYKINFLSKIKYIAVDEIQDLDEIQLEVVNLIAKYVGACIYCGDAAQSIYADFDILKNKDVMKFKKYYLNQSYRMNLTTTNFTNILRREIYTVTDETVDMIPIKETGQLAKITYHTGDFKSLIPKIAADLKVKHKGDLHDTKKSTGVLTFKNSDAKILFSNFSKQNKENFSIRFKDLNKNPAFTMLKMASLYIIVNNVLKDEKNSHFVHTNGGVSFLKKFTDNKEPILRNWKRLSSTINYMECLRNYIFYHSKESYSSSPDLKNSLEAYSTVNYKSLVTLSNENSVKLFTTKYGIKDTKYLNQALSILRKTSSIFSRKKDSIKTIEQLVRNVFAILKMEKRNEDIIPEVAGDVLKYLHSFKYDELYMCRDKIVKNPTMLKGNVFINTIHGSKGLEFDDLTLYIPYSVLKNPFFIKRIKNLIYVALTRSKNDIRIYVQIPKTYHVKVKEIAESQNRFFNLTKCFDFNGKYLGSKEGILKEKQKYIIEQVFE